MGQEYVVLVDGNNNQIGTALKSEVHTASTPLHRAFSVFLFNVKGELLLQQRAKSKKTWPGVWSNSCCGHPGPGEEVEAAVRRRLEQELGLTDMQLWNVLPNFRYRAELDGIVENEICPVFVGFTNQEPKPNSQEVEATRWIPWQQFVAETQSSDSPYSPWSVLEVVELKRSNKFKRLFADHVKTQRVV